MRPLPQKFVLFAALLVVLISSCNKSTNPTGNNGSAPAFPTFTISTPGFASDTCGAPAYIYATLIQAYLQYSTAWAAIPGQNNNGVWTWQQTDDGVTYTMTSQQQTDGSFHWMLVYNGTDTAAGRTYSNWKAMEGTASADGKNGNLTFYDDSDAPAQTVVLAVTWTTLPSGAIQATLDVYSSGQPSERFVVISNTNGSGEITGSMWTGSSWAATGYHATWASTGAPAVCS